MHTFVMHVHSDGGDDPREEGYLFLPGYDGKAVFPVPIDALPDWLPAFARVLDELDEPQACPACGELLATPEIVERFSGRG